MYSATEGLGLVYQGSRSLLSFFEVTNRTKSSFKFLSTCLAFGLFLFFYATAGTLQQAKMYFVNTVTRLLMITYRPCYWQFCPSAVLFCKVVLKLFTTRSPHYHSCAVFIFFTKCWCWAFHSSLTLWAPQNRCHWVHCTGVIYRKYGQIVLWEEERFCSHVGRTVSLCLCVHVGNGNKEYPHWSCLYLDSQESEGG